MRAKALTLIMSLLLGLGARLLFLVPDRILRLVFGPAPPVAKGLRADAWAVGRMADIIDRGPKAAGVEEMRLETDLLSSAVAAPRPPGMEIRDLSLDPDGEGGPLAARLYRPAAAAATGPLMVFFHGGGWAVGSIESHDRACALLADNSRIRLLSVEYRLAPEYPFPAAPDDALRAWLAVVANPGRFGAQPGHIAVGGDSAGGSLAAVLCQDLRHEGLAQPALQLLMYPVTEVGSTWPSMQEFSTGYYLTGERMVSFSEFYVKPDQYDDVRVSPLKADDFSGLAPAWVITGLADPLRDEGEEYAKRLAEAGVEVRCDRFPLIHAWFNMTRTRSARQAHRILADGLSAYLAEPASSPSAD